MEHVRNSYHILVGNPERKRPLGGRRYRCIVKTDLGEIVCDWTMPNGEQHDDNACSAG